MSLRHPETNNLHGETAEEAKMSLRHPKQTNSRQLWYRTKQYATTEPLERPRRGRRRRRQPPGLRARRGTAAEGQLRDEDEARQEGQVVDAQPKLSEQAAAGSGGDGGGRVRGDPSTASRRQKQTGSRDSDEN